MHKENTACNRDETLSRISLSYMTMAMSADQRKRFQIRITAVLLHRLSIHAWILVCLLSNFRECAVTIVSDDNWMDAMRNKTVEGGTATTPMRKLVLKLPGVWLVNPQTTRCVIGQSSNYQVCDWSILKLPGVRTWLFKLTQMKHDCTTKFSLLHLHISIWEG